VVQGKAKVGAVIGGFVHGSVKLRATRHDSGALRKMHAQAFCTCKAQKI
jgi:hypothetical protein